MESGLLALAPGENDRAQLNAIFHRRTRSRGRVRVRALNTELLGEVSRGEARRSWRTLDTPAVAQDVEAVLF